jgi:hypothetical protein
MTKGIEVLQFLFIVAVPLVAVAGAVITLYAVGALFYALELPAEAAQGIEALFRRKPKPSASAGPDHYYRPYWSR